MRKKHYDDDLKLDELEQYHRGQNLEFEGVPRTKDVEITQVTKDLVVKLNVDVEEDISIVHGLPVKNRTGRISNGSEHPTIIIRLVSRQKRNEIYENQFKARDIKEFPVNNMERLYINDNLTQRRKRLFRLAKQKPIELKYKFIWTNNEQIYLRENEESNRIHVKIESDLNKLE